MRRRTAARSRSQQPSRTGFSVRLNWLRAGVLGAEDGIVSTAGLVAGVAGATPARGPILTAGSPGRVAGAVSMALSEYVSVSSQRDTEPSLLDKERAEFALHPAAELAELAGIYRARGLRPGHRGAGRRRADRPRHVRRPRRHRARPGPGLPDQPLARCGESSLAFTLGALLPVLAIPLPPAHLRVGVTFVVVLLALAATGAASADLGGARSSRPSRA